MDASALTVDRALDHRQASVDGAPSHLRWKDVQNNV